jgi:hypothetical protein
MREAHCISACARVTPVEFSRTRQLLRSNADLTSKHPEIDTIPEDRIEDHDLCPWSCALDYSAGHVIVACVWSKADYVSRFVHERALRHGLAVYDPQSTRIAYPDGVQPLSSGKRACWRFW